MTIETKYNIGDEVWFMFLNKPIKGIIVKIETKYNIGDEVWFMFLNKPIKGIIAKIDVNIAKTGDWYIEHYKVEVNGAWHCKIGQSLFPSKEELLKSL